ncbi:MAG TPA: alfa-L-rhamnosidase, partial [Nocardioides sp.]
MRRHIAGLVTATLAVVLSPALPPLAASAVPSTESVGSDPVVSELRTNALVDPLGIATSAPTLGWQLDSDRRGVTQKAYQIRVASSERRLTSPDVWDSRKVKSGQSVDVRYAGPALKPRTDYVWSVRVWDDDGVVSAWSEPATFATGLGKEAWTADWIGAETPELGAEWTDYTIEFTASDIGGALGVYFRGENTENAYMWQFSESDDALRPHVKRNGGYSVLPAKPVPS